MKKNKGITLVALVITVILLLILAGISIATLTGSGLFEKARLAEQKSAEKQEEEEQTLKDYENKIGEYVDGSRDTGEEHLYYKVTGNITVKGNLYKDINLTEKIAIPEGYEIFQVITMPKYTTNYSHIITGVKIGSQGDYYINFINESSSTITFDYQINVTLVKSDKIEVVN